MANKPVKPGNPLYIENNYELAALSLIYQEFQKVMNLYNEGRAKIKSGEWVKADLRDSIQNYYGYPDGLVDELKKQYWEHRAICDSFTKSMLEFLKHHDRIILGIQEKPDDEDADEDED